MNNIKIEDKFTTLKLPIETYRKHKKQVNTLKFLYQKSKIDDDKINMFEILMEENSSLVKIKKLIFEIIREEKITNRNIFQYWLDRKEREINI